jgi:hypothetical protein
MGDCDLDDFRAMSLFFTFFFCFFVLKSQIQRVEQEGRNGANGNRETEARVIELFCAWDLWLQTCSGTVSVGGSPSR